MFVPTPYADELVGSVLMRGCRWTGMALPQYLSSLRSAFGLSHSMMMTPHPGLASKCGLSFDELVMRHTLLPLAFAFYPIDERQGRLSSFLSTHAGPSFGATVQKLVRNSRKLRVCPRCIELDRATYGETYWHRTHQIVGVYICTAHQTMLQEAMPLITSRRRLMPGDCPVERTFIKGLVPTKILEQIAGESESALDWRTQITSDPQTEYFRQTSVFGYHAGPRRIAGTIFSSDFLKFYGHRLLEDLGTPISGDLTSSWAVRMLRKPGSCFGPVRHVLMRVFLSSSPTPSIDPVAKLHAPRPRKVNYTLLDEECVAIMESIVSASSSAANLPTLASLFRAAGIASLIKHKRHHLPLTDKWSVEYSAFRRAMRKTAPPSIHLSTSSGLLK